MYNSISNPVNAQENWLGQLSFSEPPIIPTTSYNNIEQIINNTLNFKCLSDGRDISSDIISKSENNGVITIVIDDESELDSNVKLTPIFTIDKNNNSVIFSSLEDGTNFIYKFLEFTINIQ